VFEYVKHDLKTFMDQRQTSDDIRERVGLPRQMVRSFLQQILNGVGYCHTHRVLHRDLKPHNVSLFWRKTDIVPLLNSTFFIQTNKNNSCSLAQMEPTSN
jgi:serine/threonine protein kinase